MCGISAWSVELVRVSMWRPVHLGWPSQLSGRMPMACCLECYAHSVDARNINISYISTTQGEQLSLLCDSQLNPKPWLPKHTKKIKKKLDLVSLKILILKILSRLSRYRISRSEYRTTSIALWKPDQFSKYRKGPSARNYSTLQLLRILRIRRLAFLFNIDLFFLPYQACCAATDMEMPWNTIIWGGPCNDEWANVASCQLRAFPIVPENQKITDAYMIVMILRCHILWCQKTHTVACHTHMYTQ